MKKIQPSIILILGILSLILTVTGWIRLNAKAYNFTTGLVCLGAVCLLGILVAEIIMRSMKTQARTTSNLRTLLVTIGLLIFVLEIFLRFGIDQYATHREKAKGEGYKSINRHIGRSWIYTRKRNADITKKRLEFTHSRRTNSLGISEKEISTDKEEGEYRIISLGDSFTEGVGASYEETWVKVMENNLNARLPGSLIKTMNAGISGSDVFYEYMLFKEKLLDYDPDLVIIATNASDIKDVMIRGGMDRFHPDGTVQTVYNAPAWEWVYGISYIFRAIVHELLDYDQLLMKEKDVPAIRARAIDKIKESHSMFLKLAEKRGFRLVFMIHPTRPDVKKEKYGKRMKLLIDSLKKSPGIVLIDVLEEWLKNKSISAEKAESIYWPLDSHNNTEGYRLMGEAVANRIIELNIIK